MKLMEATNMHKSIRAFGASYCTAFVVILASASPVVAQKKVICIDNAGGAQSRFLNNHEGYERALGIGPNGVVQIGGNLTDCLAMVANGDELVIIAHGAPGSFTFGGQNYTAFTAMGPPAPGELLVPAGFANLMNVRVRFCSCFSMNDPPGPDTAMTAKILNAMGGAGRGHNVTGFNGTSGTAPVPTLCLGTPAQRTMAANDLNANLGWRQNAPANRPNTGGAGQPANQRTAAQAQADALLGAGVVTVKIPNQVGALGPPAVAGYIMPIDGAGFLNGSECDACNCEPFAWVDGSAGQTCFTLDFSTDDEGNPMPHGAKVDTEFDGGPVCPVTITSYVHATGQATAAILNSTTGPAAVDPDLLVGKGNILILQNDVNLTECPPASGIYCTHNDDEDGGRLSFAFNVPVSPSSIVLIDIDNGDPTSYVILVDTLGLKRTYTVPHNWTGDQIENGPPGYGTLDLTTLANQPGFLSTATAAEEAGFIGNIVARIDVLLGGSGAVDDLSWCTNAPVASVVSRNGSGVNRVTLSNASLPVIGGMWDASLDCRNFGNGLATLYVCQRAASGTMTFFGEKLIAGVVLHRTSQAFAGFVNQLTWSIPNEPALIGLDVHVQGLCMSTVPTLGPKVLRAHAELSNALDLILGY
jgi:hypothetical protein